MIIDNKAGIVDTDAVICITYEDIITAARCNGESIRQAYRSLMKIALEDAEYLIRQHENELEELARA